MAAARTRNIYLAFRFLVIKETLDVRTWYFIHRNGEWSFTRSCVS